MADNSNGALNAPIGSGMADQARNTVNLRRLYNQYVLDAQMNGQAPLTFAEWSAQMGGG